MKQKYVKIVVYVIILTMVLTSFSFIAFMPAMLGSASATVYGESTEDEAIDEELALLEKYIQFIYHNYTDELDYQQLIDGAFRGVVEALGDPYSEYYKNKSESSQFIDSVDGSFEGIGVTIQLIDGKCTVIQPLAGGPAEQAGIKSGDIITTVDGKTTEGLVLSNISDMLRGPQGTKVTVTVDRDGKILTFSVERDKVEQNCVSYEMIGEEIGYIEMTGFDSDANLEFKKARIALTNQGAESFILDLRDNPGGYVDMALDIADQILEEGYISHFESKGKLLKSYSATKTEFVLQPIVLLVNENTASASEILAAALHDNHAAVLVGTKTYGKGVAQQIAQLDGEKSVKLSIYYFLTPNKDRIQGVGITPDYVIPKGTENAAAEASYNGFAPMTENEKPAFGEIGLNVYGAQQRLALLGYDVKVSGSMDAETVAAVKAFQNQNGLYAYGVLDYTTMKALETAAYSYAHGIDSEDLQLQKAVELLTE